MDVVVDGRADAVEEVLADFGRWLSVERAVATETVRCYRSRRGNSWLICPRR